MDSYDFEVFKGSTFALSLILKDGSENPVDLTDYSVSGFLKYKYSDTNKLTSLNTTRESPYNSGIITLFIDSNTTATLPVTLAQYDVEIYHTGGTTEKVLRGNVTIQPEITY